MLLRRVKQQLTPAEISSHCAPEWKNELYGDARFHALSLAAPSGSCPAQRDFAVIGTASGDVVNVELGGCRRVK